MRDQASALRNLIQCHSAAEPSSANDRRARVVAFTSGKGGVGKSNLALNVAVALAEFGLRVCVLDANPGLSNIDVLCGLNGYWHLGHVLSGAKSLHDVILKGPAGINVVPGASGLLDFAEMDDRTESNLFRQFDALESAYDILMVDAGAGLQRVAWRFASAADAVYLVTTPEPTAIADAYATLKTWNTKLPACPELIVNRAASPQQAQEILIRFAQTAELFLNCSGLTGNSVAEDSCVADAVVQRQPFVCAFPDSAATRDVRQLARRLHGRLINSSSEPFHRRLSHETACEVT